MLYFSVVCAVVFCLYFAPSQALFPRLILSSRTAPGVPFVSLLIISTTYFLLKEIGWASQIVVLAVSCIIGIVAIARTFWVLKSKDTTWQWPRTHVLLGIFLLALSAIWAVRLGTTGFDRDDEIYSWNMWAIQHWLGHEVDLYYTRAPYPQLLPMVLAYTYELFGHFKFQMPTKLTLAILPLSAWFAIMVSPRSKARSTALLSALLGLILILEIGREFSTGLADPMVASAITLTVYFFILYRRSPSQPSLLFISLACGAVAVLSKQPGMIWALFAFPLITSFMVLSKKAPPKLLMAPAVLALLAVSWLIGPGSGFADNEGVIARSQQGMEWHQVIWASFETWGIGEPVILLILIGALFATYKTRENLDIVGFFLLPALVLWWLYGSYHLRLGAHTVTVAALLIAAADYPFGKITTAYSNRLATKMRRSAIPVIFSLLALSLIASLFDSLNRIGDYGPDFDWQEPSANGLYRQMGPNAREAFAQITENPTNKLWAPSNYVYGIFYGSVQVTRPGYKVGERYSAADLVREISNDRPDFLIDTGETPIAFGPGTDVLNQLATIDCPFLFEPLFDISDRKTYQVYKFRGSEVALLECQENIL